MDQTVITIIAIFLAAVLMFIFPLLSISERNEDIAQLAVQTATTEFVDNAATTGVITQTAYDAYVQKLGATGNTYDIEIEVKILDENPGKKVSITSKDLIGENLYYSVFYSEIEAKMNEIVDGEPYGRYPLKKGDNIIVTVKNSNVTVAQLIRNFFYAMAGKAGYQVGASHAQMVVNTGKQ
jgi:hypothetical protein